MEHVGGSLRDHTCDIQEHMADQKQWNNDEREWYQISDTAMIVVLQKYYKDVKLAFENSVIAKDITKLGKLAAAKYRQWCIDAGGQSVMIDDLPEEVIGSMWAMFYNEAKEEMKFSAVYGFTLKT